MANAVINSINIAGISTCVPKNVDKIADYKLIPENERDGFIKMVGVNQRRVADKGVVTSDLCYNAAINLMNKLGWDPLSVNALIFVTQSPDYLIPSTAIILQHRLGLSENCIAFDINLGCSGYVIWLQVSSLMNSSGISRAILLSGMFQQLICLIMTKAPTPCLEMQVRLQLLNTMKMRRICFLHR